MSILPPTGARDFAVLLGGGQMQLLPTLQLPKTANYHRATFGCLSTIAYKCLQLNTKFQTGSKTVAVFLGGGQISCQQCYYG
jgi:hypothetical protein